MRFSLVAAFLIASTVPLAGCLGGNDAFVPGEGFEETGKTVHIKMWVRDLVKAEIYPGFRANLWAFCAAPANANDAYSANAIEYRDTQPLGTVANVDSDGNLVEDADDLARCSVPGPQLRVQQGDRVIVDFTNNHFHPHTIHWHGQFVPWESDGVPGSTQDSVVPPPAGSGNFRYEFIAKRAGTMWYHCHVDTQFHVMQGLYGVIIVEPQAEAEKGPDYDKEYTLVLSNLLSEHVEYIPPRPGEVFDPHAQHKAAGGHSCGVSSGFPQCQNPAIDADPDVFMINGVSAPNTFMRDDTLMSIKPGEVVKVRVLNAGPFTTETMHLHGHDMLITHQDGNPVPEPYYVDTFVIGPGQRFDFLVEGREDAQGVWVIHTHITSRVTNSGQYPGGMITKLVYEGFETQPYDGVELPGGQKTRFRVDIPDDYLDRQIVPLELDPEDPQSGERASIALPIEQPCAVKQVRITGHITSTNPVFEAVTDLTVDLIDPDGTIIATAAVGGLLGTVLNADSFAFLINETTDAFKVAELMAGDHTLHITGTTIDATADVELYVDYYRDLDEADEASLNYSRPLCGAIPADIEDGYYA